VPQGAVQDEGAVMRRFACFVVVLVLAGCSRSAERVGAVRERVDPPVASTPAETYAWARSDGQRMAANPELTAQAQADIAECQAETPPRAARGVPGEPCMRERGYYVRRVE
jgi:hypothetical protein